MAQLAFPAQGKKLTKLASRANRYTPSTSMTSSAPPRLQNATSCRESTRLPTVPRGPTTTPGSLNSLQSACHQTPKRGSRLDLLEALEHPLDPGAALRLAKAWLSYDRTRLALQAFEQATSRCNGFARMPGLASLRPDDRPV